MTMADLRTAAGEAIERVREALGLPVGSDVASLVTAIEALKAERDRLRTEVKHLGARVREWEAVHADLAARCDSGDIPVRLGERYSQAVLREIDRLRAELEMAEQDRDLARQAAEGRQRERDEARAELRQAEQERDEARREWRGLIDRIRTDASARGLDIEPGEDLVDGLLRIIDDRGKDRDDWQRQAEAADSLRAEVERHAGAQCGCDTNGECLARLYQQTRALAATAPETGPESPHTAEPAPAQAEAASEPLTAAEVKLPARLATMRRRLEDAEQAIAEALRLAARLLASRTLTDSPSTPDTRSAGS